MLHDSPFFCADDDERQKYDSCSHADGEERVNRGHGIRIFSPPADGFNAASYDHQSKMPVFLSYLFLKCCAKVCCSHVHPTGYQ
jgi:hypothetical protein